jgi:hypothetical protein
MIETLLIKCVKRCRLVIEITHEHMSSFHADFANSLLIRVVNFKLCAGERGSLIA